MFEDLPEPVAMATSTIVSSVSAASIFLPGAVKEKEEQEEEEEDSECVLGFFSAHVI